MPFRNRALVETEPRLPRLVDSNAIAVWGETAVQIWFEARPLC